MKSYLARMLEYLGKDFAVAGTVEMWEMFLVVIVHKKDAANFHSLRTNYIATGFGNVVGNKGAIQVAFTLYGRKFSFLNCHLESGAHKCLQRC